MDKQDLRGMAALITGGGTEVAGAVALALAHAGVQVGLCGPQADLLELAASPIRSMGGVCLALESELDSLEAAEAARDQALAVFGRLDLLIMVSPFWAGGLIHNHSVKAWDAVLNANLRQPFLAARAVLPVFRAQQHGEVMAIGSDSALGFYAQDGAFGVAMHGLSALMELIRLENAESGIRTHILSPGVAASFDADFTGKPTLSVSHVAEWAVWVLTRPPHLRGSGPILI